MSREVFVLDIGTRSVMALLARLEGEDLRVLHLRHQEHKTRAMMDGQIHNVEQVASVIIKLTREIRELAGSGIREVAVAAAGRSLQTVRGTARLRLPYAASITAEDLQSLQLQAVQEAQLSLPQGQSRLPLSQQYYCVGYSLVEQRLDGIVLGSLVGQKGQEAEVTVVTTFLPRIVLDSLQTAVEMAGLTVTSITLEPIAVANLVLNPTMRRLNLVLVDIGAGTSDLAVCGGNTISAYGMVPMAGDEITEALCDAYLLDFQQAEAVKRQVTASDVIPTVDVLGHKLELSAAEIKKTLEIPVEGLAGAIAQEVFNLNGKAPQALLLVGGGSMTPGLPASLAKALAIPEGRVAVQKADRLPNIHELAPELTGPDFITVLGIAYTALTAPTMGFISVYINDREVRLLNLVQNSVAEALLSGGYNIRDIYGRPGLALTCEIDGKLHIMQGKQGIPGRIQRNDQPASFGDKVHQGDRLIFEPGQAGEDARGTYRQLLHDLKSECQVNSLPCQLDIHLLIDGRKVSLDEPVQDGVKAVLIRNVTLLDVVRQMRLITDNHYIRINGKQHSLLEYATLRKNGQKAAALDAVAAGDLILVDLPNSLRVEDVLPRNNALALEVIVNGKPVLLGNCRILVNNQPADYQTRIKAKDVIEVGTAQYQPILIDIFKEINFSARPPAGKSKLLLLVNEQEKEYTYPLQKGDVVQIAWV